MVTVNVNLISIQHKTKLLFPLPPSPVPQPVSQATAKEGYGEAQRVQDPSLCHTPGHSLHPKRRGDICISGIPCAQVQGTMPVSPSLAPTSPSLPSYFLPFVGSIMTSPNQAARFPAEGSSESGLGGRKTSWVWLLQATVGRFLRSQSSSHTQRPCTVRVAPGVFQALSLRKDPSSFITAVRRARAPGGCIPCKLGSEHVSCTGTGPRCWALPAEPSCRPHHGANCAKAVAPAPVLEKSPRTWCQLCQQGSFTADDTTGNHIDTGMFNG